ncbi:MAG: AlkZ family DNA glycosylase [Saprospiraceae bacterium]|nr:AlkZ family DNA glycosylase [Saprospiraceae bacterium]
MKNLNIPAFRLHQQNIIKSRFDTPQYLVAYMGAIQAQDYPMSKFAIGLRLPNATDATIEAALDAGELVRTHVLRPTWHIVSGQDVRWMLALTGKSIKASAASRDRDLGIDAALYAKTNDLIVKALEGGKNLTREEIMQYLEQHGVATNSSLAVHFMMNAETDAIVCNGKMRGKDITYALMDEKVPKGLDLSREEALATLAERYFTSHAPATVHDFQWWSGLNMTDAKKGLESIKNQLNTVDFNGKTYFFSKNHDYTEGVESLFFLPAFDEYTVSYKDRSTIFDPIWHKEAITSNGIFKPIIVANGKVVGIWKRTIAKNKVVVEPSFFSKTDALPPETIQKVMQKFGDFLGLSVQVKI